MFSLFFLPFSFLLKSKASVVNVCKVVFIWPCFLSVPPQRCLLASPFVLSTSVLTFLGSSSLPWIWLESSNTQATKACPRGEDFWVCLFQSGCQSPAACAISALGICLSVDLIMEAEITFEMVKRLDTKATASPSSLFYNP